jgi:hypothetical protein
MNSRDIELQKIQSLDGYFQTKINANYATGASILIGFLFTLLTLYYNKVFEITKNIFYNQIIFIIILLTVGIVIDWQFLRPARKLHDQYLAKIDSLITRVENGETLESLLELKKVGRGNLKKNE